ncbi:DUF6458 family protein [Patulibacter brassicae]|jgi:hypothetical protein|uniref:DUF6458 family protein n=1 Tax=Patulibacter brassicae TaxID=1705717 RepID=A0ABU4VFS3_9ACTN|nr:DUF6458 family protein [Patulibacter brassicae]MDX8150670.1 DUF6458 family protein [Patulibacter brassicae]
MSIGTSLFLIAVGAILRFAVTASVAGVKLETVGLILMIVGALGLILSLLVLNRARGVVVERPVDPYRGEPRP